MQFPLNGDESVDMNFTIEIKYYRIDFPDNNMEGSFHDILTGPVSEEGLVWKPMWTATSEIIGSGVSTVGPKELIFSKIADANE